MVLFVAVHTHPAAQCPLKTDEGKLMVKQLFSEENTKQAGVKIVGAYVSCPKDGGVDHKGFFVVEAASAAVVTAFFGPMMVDLREVVPFSEVAKTM
jgi:hypothetical protein